MSKLTDQFRARWIHNICEFYGNEPYVVYYPRQIGRGGSSPRWAARKADKNLSEAWYDYGARTFLVWNDKKKALAEAQAFVTDKFGVKEFARDPFGGYGEANFVKARIKEILALPEKI